MTFDESIAARTLYGECRGEPEDGQRAVAHVLVNRMRDGRWGKNLIDVCLARHQFSCWNASDPNRPKMLALTETNAELWHFSELIHNALIGTDIDPTMGAMWYYAVSIPEPAWAKGKSFMQIGNHRFLKDVD